MAYPSNAARNLSLTEELERIEQSITLTLQGMVAHHFAAVECRLETNWQPLQKSTTTSAKLTASLQPAFFQL
jgi:DASH complex subunit ASK1